MWLVRKKKGKRAREAFMEKWGDSFILPVCSGEFAARGPHVRCPDA
jgi:hypothetical protein